MSMYDTFERAHESAGTEAFHGSEESLAGGLSQASLPQSNLSTEERVALQRMENDAINLITKARVIERDMYSRNMASPTQVAAKERLLGRAAQIEAFLAEF